MDGYIVDIDTDADAMMVAVTLCTETWVIVEIAVGTPLAVIVLN